ncbi:proteic killer suppression protein [Carboxydocella sporoproducens DSM 16521]|uniref:Proteic killer suppression protein n=2 Tax=Carboxydocella TaxID=178898 RepID=A0A1T4QBZ5_9FIRM|nr:MULTISPECIES: type II toxin-antitoxin system RelE/ParE family toxin [Carboxydocella]AVX21643.1 proteic killer suppression protein [Carboxydocella thermautotrophica]SKA01259.1 proteic killer suppression protein [Carboxydocella sporoproducens DSM 16521]
MYIYFKQKKLQKISCSERKIIKSFGEKIGQKLMQRLSELKAAKDLSEISHLPPQRLHLLSGDRANHFSVDLTANYRLIFTSPEITEALNPDGTLDKAKIKTVIIIEVVDYHD